MLMVEADHMSEAAPHNENAKSRRTLYSAESCVKSILQIAGMRAISTRLTIPRLAVVARN